MRKTNPCLYLFLLPAVFLSVALPLHAEENSGLSAGQALYVPVYSHIYSGNQEMPFLLTVTLSIRNIDPKNSFKITRVDYFDSKGKLLEKYLSNAVDLGPMESIRYVVPQKENKGGSGANFIVEWKSGRPMNPPIVESVMIGTQSQQGVSFTSRGREIK